MATVLGILKIIGIVLLCILGVVLLLGLLLLFWPFSYRIEAAKTESIRGRVSISWLLHLLIVEVLWDGRLNKRLRILGIPVYDQRKKEAKAARKAAKERRKAQRKSSKKPDAETDGSVEADAEMLKAEGTEEPLSETVWEDGKTDRNDKEAGLRTGTETDNGGGYDHSSPEQKEKTKNGKGNERRRGFPEKLFERCRQTWERFSDFLDRAPEKLGDWLDYLPEKADEVLETIDYYDRLLNSSGTEEVIKTVKKHGGALLFHALPRRSDITLDYCDDDPARVAKLYEIQAMTLPLQEWICGKRGRFDLLAMQDEKKIHLSLVIRGHVVLSYMAWHALILLLDKRVKAFYKRLKREGQESGHS